MTGPAGRRTRLLMSAALACAAASAAGAIALAQPAGAAVPGRVTGGDVQPTAPVQVGDTVRADARVSGACSGVTITFTGGGRVLGSGQMSTYKSYYTEFSAFPGLSTITADVGGGSVVLGTVDVVGATPPPPPATSVSRTPSRPPATSRAAPTSASATPGGSKTATRSLTPHTAAFPAAAGDVSTSDTSTQQPSASASPTSSDVALPVQVIHGSGGVNLIPAGLLIAMIVVLGAIAGAAVHFIRAYSRSPDHLT